MNYRLLLLQLHLPECLKRRQLLELFRRTASVLGGADGQGCLPVEASRPASSRQLLAAFARFTRERARSFDLAGPGRLAMLAGLRREAEAMGRHLRENLNVRTSRQFRTALRLVYRSLDIDLRVSTSGEVVVRRCFFSAHYTPAACRLMSALDDGLVRGLSGGARLHFTCRLTEGFPSCRATLRWPGDEAPHRDSSPEEEP